MGYNNQIVVTEKPTAPLVVKLTRRKIKSIIQNPEKSSQAVNLIYVSDKQLGIFRQIDDIEIDDNKVDITKEEKVVMKILEGIK